MGDVIDDRSILPLLEQDRCWSAYALCDLEPPYRERTRLLAASAGGEIKALVLLYTLPGTTSLLPYGEVSGVAAILQETEDLPSSIFMVTPDEYVPVLAQRYRLSGQANLWRMVVTADDVGSMPSDHTPVVRLRAADANTARELYGHWAEKMFDPLMLSSGIYYGIEGGSGFVAIAGTHALSPARRLAAIGGVFTHPDYRGRGLAGAVTGGVCRDLVARGIELIVLNVRQDNAPAIAVYRRLGFRTWVPFVDGHGVLR